MANYVLVYKGGGGMQQTPEAQQAEMARWTEWFGSVGSAVVDGGNPFGPSASVGADGKVSNSASSGLTGYSILKADNMQAATDMAKGCPILKSGGMIEVYETFAVM
jgi:hypothetical protein